MPNPIQASELMALLDVECDGCTPTRVSGSIAADAFVGRPFISI